ncbi:zinc finger protein 226-like isoform X2 [Uranotaenia lowii]|uniref:zinc finger protein 226-like isoform X2 n=1 Tax=Uranotaenia lowii TaxID=190385 RepID=UPI002478CA62|nr:zinc finger protein 226-like isoform X2 [Uranotaenia lowii]
MLMDVYAVCRMCISAKLRLRSIFLEYNDSNMMQIITDVLRLEISEDDGLPPNVCKPCATTILKMGDTIEAFRQNDQKLRELILKGETIVICEKSDVCDGIKESEVELDVGNVDNDEQMITMELATVDVDCLIKDEPEDIIETAKEIREQIDDTNDSSELPIEEEYLEDDDDDDQFIPQNTVIPKKPKIIKKKRARDPERMSRNQLKHLPGRPRLHDHICYICNSEPLGSAKNLLDHLTIQHQGIFPYTCSDCVMETIVLKNARSLNNHKKMHAQPLKCSYCDRRYCDNAARELHVQSYHMGEGAPCPSPCDLCGKVCKSQTALKNHLREHKTQLKCPQCDKIFHKPSLLKRHFGRIHEPRTNTYTCEICHAVLASMEGYNNHLKIHGEKEYECDICHIKFHNIGNLCAHRKVHVKNANYQPPKRDWNNHYTVSHETNGSRTFTCNHCGKKAACSTNLFVSHIKTHFKTFTCEVCGMKFSTNNYLQGHMVVHTKERNYHCELCGKHYPCQSNLNRHIRTVHHSKGVNVKPVIRHQ